MAKKIITNGRQQRERKKIVRTKPYKDNEVLRVSKRGFNEGKPPKWADPEKFDEAVRAYFANNTITHTWTGLALHLGFSSRQSLDDYRKSEGFADSVAFAMLKIENKYEERLNSSKNPVGSIFGLKNFGWKDKQEIKHEGIPDAPAISVKIVHPKDEE